MSVKKNLLYIGVVIFLFCFPYKGVSESKRIEKDSSIRETKVVTLKKTQKYLNGVIQGEDGEPISGVEVYNLNTEAYVASDLKGSFSIEGSLSDKFRFKMIGFETLVLLGEDIESVILKVSETSLDEVVVVGYGSQKKINLTGAVSSIHFNEVSDSRPTLNLSSALTGLSAGLNISQTSAAPGAEGFGLLVRGMGTMNDASPLVVIDGVPGALNDINPNDVETVSILKDASSAAIYGSRAANGVVLVTTKRGAEGFSLTYNGYVGQQNVAKELDFISDMATHMELVNESEGRDKYDPDLIEKWRTESSNGNPLYPSTNWYNEMLNSSLLTEHNLSVKGGGGKSAFLMSLGYLDNKGIIDNSKFTKYDFRLNGDANFKDVLNIGGDVYGIWSDRAPLNVSSFFDNIRNTTPGVVPKYEDGRYGGEMFPDLPPGNNPRAYVDNVRGNYEQQRLGMRFFLKLKVFKDIEWENSIGFKYGNNRNWEYSRPFSLWNLQTEFQYPARPSIDALTNGSRRDYSTVLNSLIRYSKEFDDRHSLSMMLGYDQQYNRMDIFNAKKDDVLGDDAIYIMDAAANMVSITGSGTDDALQSYFGRINYNYKNKYLFEANGRYDGSSRFSPENRWGFFPSFSGGWRIIEEEFASSIKSVVDELKIRGSWGRLGNNRIGDYTWQVVLGSYLYPFGGQLEQGVGPVELANNRIKWETTTISNIGMDIALLKNKLTISAEYFNKTTSDILTKIPVPLILGNFSPPWQNIAEMKNKGIEFEINYRGEVNRDLSYTVSGNFSTNSNTVTKFNDDRSINGPTITQEGTPFNSFYLLEFDRILQDEAEIQALLDDGYTFGAYVGGVPEPGDILYKDINGDKKFNEEDRVVKEYSSLPKLNYGLNIGAVYKRFDVNIVAHGVGKTRQYWGNDGFNTFNINEGFLQRAEILNRWTEDNKTSKYPRLRTSGSALNTVNSDYWLYNTSFFRIKSLQLGYSFPESKASKLFIGNLRAYVNLENFFTFTQFKGYNPENASMAYPLMKQWVIGLNVTF